MKLWSKEEEIKFLKVYLKSISPEKLFYLTDDSTYYTYYPKNYKGKKTTLQSRNTYIGDYTENWVKNLLEEIAKNLGYYVVIGAICDEIGLSRLSPADVAICKTPDKFQNAENIVCIFEVKMSIVWNWEYLLKEDLLGEVGDLTTHIGTPSLLRSDSMLKAIGKAVNIRASGISGSKIPIIILGNSPITSHYHKKVDNLKKIGIIQGFWSINPNPYNNDNNCNLKKTENEGFYRFDDYDEFKSKLLPILSNKMQFFGGMINKNELGQIISKSNMGKTYEEKAGLFIKYIWGE